MATWNTYVCVDSAEETAVFGSKLLELGPGNAMWRLAGYGDHLEERSRRRTGEWATEAGSRPRRPGV
jgi:hypothetical protein